MKLIYLLPFALLISCQETEKETENEEKETVVEETANADSLYGEAVDTTMIMSTEEFLAQMADADSLVDVVISGTIIETCAKKGCWMEIDMGQEDPMRVSFKDYGFFVPTGGVSGRNVIMQGMAYYDTLSVDFQKHLAEDGNRSQEEIDAITEPKPVLAFEATGVIIREE